MSAALLLLMLAAVDEPPQVGRPVDFSGVVGRFRIEAEVSPKSLTVEDPLTLSVTIRGDGVTTPPTRDRLRLFPEEIDFFREDVVDEDRADPATGTWTFVWRLRPKSIDVREIPELRLTYWSPMVRRFQSATVDPVAIEVKPREAMTETPKSVEGPIDDRFLDIAPPTIFDRWGNLIIILSALAICVVIQIVSARAAATEPPRAVSAIARAELKHGGAAALTRYLQLRFALKADEPTPVEIERTLRRADIEPEVRAEWADWWHRYDLRRFSRPEKETSEDRDEAWNLICQTEESWLCR